MKCQLQVEAYEVDETDQLDQQVFELDENDILDAMMWMRDVSAEFQDRITHFDVQVICDGGYYDSNSFPPFRKDIRMV